MHYCYSHLLFYSPVPESLLIYSAQSVSDSLLIDGPVSLSSLICILVFQSLIQTIYYLSFLSTALYPSPSLSTSLLCDKPCIRFIYSPVSLSMPIYSLVFASNLYNPLPFALLMYCPVILSPAVSLFLLIYSPLPFP